jgi:hypothetical protein
MGRATRVARVSVIRRARRAYPVVVTYVVVRKYANLEEPQVKHNAREETRTDDSEKEKEGGCIATSSNRRERECESGF